MHPPTNNRAITLWPLGKKAAHAHFASFEWVCRVAVQVQRSNLPILCEETDAIWCYQENCLCVVQLLQRGQRINFKGQKLCDSNMFHPECMYTQRSQDHSCFAAFPERPEEWVAKNSRRIWRQDQIKREYWHQRAPVFLQSRNRAWVLKACFWDWQMSSRSDHLLHKEPGTLPCPCEQKALLVLSLRPPAAQRARYSALPL